VLDILFATTTMVTALAHGATRVIPVADEQAARREAQKHAAAEVVLAGELYAEAKEREATLALARGALGELIRQRFADWKLTPGETEVALFALKGCAIAEIATLRGTSAGTVRSQLSQVYAKSGVSSQPMLMSLFLDDLLDTRGVMPDEHPAGSPPRA